jgi:hypothetical protein
MEGLGGVGGRGGERVVGGERVPFGDECGGVGQGRFAKGRAVEKGLDAGR